MNAHALRSTLLGAFVATTLAACGGAGPPARAPESGAAEPEADPVSVEEAQQQIARAQAQLSGSSRSADAPAATDASPPAKAAIVPPPAEPAPDARPGSMSKSGVGEGTCSNPCRALASMRRAVTALCRMTGDADARCLDARRTLTDSEGRIVPCSC